MLILWEGYRECSSCSRDTYPESYHQVLVYEGKRGCGYLGTKGI